MIDGVDFTDPIPPAEVARIFAVHPKTVTRWAQVGRLASIRTPGGQRRFSRVQVEALLLNGVAGVQNPGEQR
jgi:excisionase family DNA binding protein